MIVSLHFNLLCHVCVLQFVACPVLIEMYNLGVIDSQANT